ncbi:amidase [Mycobacterium sp. NPDC003449]
MTPTALESLSIRDLGGLLRNRSLSVLEVVDDRLERVRASTLDSFVTVCDTQARERAAVLDRELRSGYCRGPLHGVPVAVKDVFLTRGVRTTAGSRLFDDYVPDSTAEVVTSMETAGAVVLGKTATQELAYGGTGDRCAYRTPRNPLDRSRITGGSSGGSASAVAEGLVWAALGTDTGGSVRIPAALCGAVGMKPTAGLLSTTGVLPLSPTMDHVGILSRTIDDNRVLLGQLASIPGGRPAAAARIGIPANYYFDDVDRVIADDVLGVIPHLVRAGMTIVEVGVPGASELYSAQRTILSYEAFAEYGSLVRDRPADVDPYVRERVQAGASITSGAYSEALTQRATADELFGRLWDRVDVILTPTTPLHATPLLADTAELNGREINVGAHLARLTAISNLAGLPSLAVPIRSPSIGGLPSSCQLIGPRSSEAMLYNLAENLSRSWGL